MRFEQWRIKEIYRWSDYENRIMFWLGDEIWDTQQYLETRADKLTKEQKQELQNAIDDMNLYT